MSFGSPHFLWLFLLVLGSGPWAIRGQRLRARSWRLLAQRGKVPNLRSLSMLLAAVFLILALARPRFGSIIGPPLPPGHDVALLIDVSRSMGAEDAVPNRLAVAIDAAESLVNALAADPANRVAIVVFAGRGVVRYPLTENLGAVEDVLHRLRPGSVRPGGTDLGAGLDAALEALGQEEHAAGRSIVIFSDGEDLAEHWRSRLDRLVQAGVIVHGVAIGDAEQGHPVPSGTGDQPLSYQGEKVLSRRVDTALEAIAQETDGAVLKLGLAAADLKTLYRTRIAPVAQRKRAAGRFAERPERFPLFLAAALGLALSGCWPGGRIGPWRWVWSRVAGAVLLGGLAVAGIGAGQGQGNGSLPPDPGAAGTRTISHSAQAGIPPGAPAAALVARGESAYLAGQFTEALSMFEAAIERAPGQPIPRYDAAATLFQLQRYEEARQRYQEARDRASTALRTKIDYALGNVALVLGDIAGAVEHYDHCLASTAVGAGLDAVRQDAAINRQFALEQAPPSLAPQGESDRDQSPSKQRNRPPGARKRGDGGSDPTPDDSAGTDPNLMARTRRVQRTTGQRKAAGEPGAAGEPELPPGSAGESPDDRLDNALDQIRDASAGGSPRIRQPIPPAIHARTGEAMRPPACGLPARRISLANFPALSIMLLVLLLCMRSEPARARPPDALRVRLEAGPGPYYEGQGIELAALVLGRDQRPTIELPRPSHAELWTAGTSFQPISATGIGQVTSGENLYITRLRLVPRRSGPLEIPPILARIDGRSGRSGPLRLAIEPVPFEGRPAEFLGGVGDFSVQASVTPASIRVGQEFIYRIRITGPAAWGTTSRPDLSRLERIPLAPRVRALARRENE